MDNDDFKALEAAFREAIRYRSSVGARSPVPDYDPAQLRQAFSGPLPVTGTPGEEVIAYLAKGADPGPPGRCANGPCAAWPRPAPGASVPPACATLLSSEVLPLKLNPMV